MHDAALDRGRTPMTNEIVGGRVVDADCHILEPPDIWENWLPSKYEDKAPKLVKDAEGGDAWLTAVGGEPDPIGLVSTPGMPFDKFRWFGVTYEEARAGCYNGAERLKDMDIDGVDAEILFPPQRTIGHFLGDDDDDFVLAGVEAYNNFLLEEFCAPDPSRLIGLAQIPSLGTDSAIEVLRGSGSTMYGSDAVGGVVNIITRGDFEGTEATLYSGGTSRGDGIAYDASFVTGYNSENKQGSILFSAGVQRQRPVFAGDRPFSSYDKTYDFGNRVEVRSGSTAVPGVCSARSW